MGAERRKLRHHAAALRSHHHRQDRPTGTAAGRRTADRQHLGEGQRPGRNGPCHSPDQDRHGSLPGQPRDGRGHRPDAGGLHRLQDTAGRHLRRGPVSGHGDPAAAGRYRPGVRRDPEHLRQGPGKLRDRKRQVRGHHHREPGNQPAAGGRATGSATARYRAPRRASIRAPSASPPRWPPDGASRSTG